MLEIQPRRDNYAYECTYVYKYADNFYQVLKIEQLATVPLAERKHRILLNCLVFQRLLPVDDQLSPLSTIRTYVEINNSAGHAAKNLKVSAVIARNFILLGCFLALSTERTNKKPRFARDTA